MTHQKKKATSKRLQRAPFGGKTRHQTTLRRRYSRNPTFLRSQWQGYWNTISQRPEETEYQSISMVRYDNSKLEQRLLPCHPQSKKRKSSFDCDVDGLPILPIPKKSRWDVPVNTYTTQQMPHHTTSLIYSTNLLDTTTAVDFTLMLPCDVKNTYMRGTKRSQGYIYENKDAQQMNNMTLPTVPATNEFKSQKTVVDFTLKIPNAEGKPMFAQRSFRDVDERQRRRYATSLNPTFSANELMKPKFAFTTPLSDTLHSKSANMKSLVDFTSMLPPRTKFVGTKCCESDGQSFDELYFYSSNSREEVPEYIREYGCTTPICENSYTVRYDSNVVSDDSGYWATPPQIRTPKRTPGYTLSQQMQLFQRAQKYAFHTKRLHMLPITTVYRNKPPKYFKEIMHLSNPQRGLMKRYAKSENGSPENHLNGHVEGLFFSTKVNKHTLMPNAFSHFGSCRITIPIRALFSNVTLYFADFYCTTVAHKITVVAAITGSVEDKYCRRNLLDLNEFPDNGLFEFEHDVDGFVSGARVTQFAIVEIFYAHDVNLLQLLSEGALTFSTVKATHEDTPKGTRKNFNCKICNLNL